MTIDWMIIESITVGEITSWNGCRLNKCRWNDHRLMIIDTITVGKMTSWMPVC